MVPYINWHKVTSLFDIHIYVCVMYIYIVCVYMYIINIYDVT